MEKRWARRLKGNEKRRGGGGELIPCGEPQGTEADGEALGTAAEGEAQRLREAMGWMLFVGWWGDLGSPFCIGFV